VGQNANLGCNPTSITFSSPTATDACGTPTLTFADTDGGTTCAPNRTRKWTATDACNNVSTASQTLTWTADIIPPVITCPPNQTICIGGVPNTTVTASDNCGGTPTLGGSWSPALDVNTPGVYTYTATATDACGNISTCSYIVTVANVTLSCSVAPSIIDITSAAHNTTLSVSFAGSTDTNPDNYNYEWTEDGGGSFNANNIKNPVYTAVPGDQGGTISFTVKATHKTTGCSSTSACSVIVSATGNCTITGPSPVCAGSTNTYSSPLHTNEASRLWSVSGTGASISGSATGLSVDVLAGNSNYIVTLTIQTLNPDISFSCNITVTVDACAVNCTYTQGKYSNKSPACDADGIDGSGEAYTYSTVTKMIEYLLGVHGTANPLVVGAGSITVTVPATAAAADLLNKSMPGGSTARELWGSCSVVSSNACWTASSNTTSSYLDTKGKINNVLLSQTIALGLNIRLSGGLGGFALQAGTFATAKAIGGCGSTTPLERTCTYDLIDPTKVIVVNEYLYKTIPASVITALTNKGYPHTVAGLYALANDALANVDGIVGFEGAASLSHINDAVSRINEGFDECRVFIGWNVGPCVPTAPTTIFRSENGVDVTLDNAKELKATAFPNPYTSRFSLNIQTPESGMATIRFYTVNGAMLSEMRHYVQTGINNVVEVQGTDKFKANTFYRVNVGNYQTTGKVIKPD
jgi:hypothetical protein